MEQVNKTWGNLSKDLGYIIMCMNVATEPIFIYRWNT